MKNLKNGGNCGARSQGPNRPAPRLRQIDYNGKLADFYKSELSTSLENYDGLYLFGMNKGLNKIYMWDETLKSFVCIHENRIELS